MMNPIFLLDSVGFPFPIDALFYEDCLDLLYSIIAELACSGVESGAVGIILADITRVNRICK